MLVVSPCNQLTLAQEVDRPRPDVLPYPVGLGSGRIPDLSGACRFEAEPGADAMTQQKNCLQPGWVMTKDSEENIDNAWITMRQSNTIRISEEGAFDQRAIQR